VIVSKGRIVLGITGASGFIGRALVRRAAAQSHLSLRLFDRCAGTIDGLPVSVLEDTSSSLDGVDALIHLAGLTPKRGNETGYHEINVELAERVAKAAVLANVKRFVLASSLHVHGHSSQTAITPDTLLRPESPYAGSKAEAEHCVKSILANTETTCSIVRPPVVYGPGMAGKFAALAKVIRLGVPLPGGASGVRSMISVSNAAHAFLHCATTDIAQGQVLIPADPYDVNMVDLMRMIGRITNRHVRFLPISHSIARILTLPLGRGFADSLFTNMQVDRAHWNTLLWQPAEDTEQGLRLALQYSKILQPS
jgi:nucleoside-diphosphate-sugar epimerase